MQMALVYNRQEKRFELSDLTIILTDRLLGEWLLHCYGVFEFPDCAIFPAFTGSQLVDAMNWANEHGKRVGDCWN
jgi:hypothetical protein